MFTKKSILRGAAILFIGALTLMSFLPAHATPPTSTESTKITNVDFISSKQLPGTHLSMPQADSGTTTRDIVLVIDTSSSMAYETTAGGDPNRSDPAVPGVHAGDDPTACNASQTCEPMETVKSAAIGFTGLLTFPSDRVAIVTTTSQSPGGTRMPTLVLPFTSDKSTVQNALANLKVFQPFTCPIDSSTPLGACLYYDPSDGHYIGQTCIPYLVGTKDANGNLLTDAYGNILLDPTSCGVNNIGSGLFMAGDELADARQNSSRVVVALISGPANAAVPPAVPLGVCPSNTWDLPSGSGFCRDLDPMPASFTPPVVSSWANSAQVAAFNGYVMAYDWAAYDMSLATRHPNTDSNYDADDYARDGADYITSPTDGQGASLYSICMGNYCRAYPNSYDPASAELLARYMSSHAGGTNASHGNYYLVLDAASLPPVFQAIAENTLCSPTVVVANNLDAGAGSLRQAISDVCDGGTITFDPSLAGQTIHLASTLLIDKSITIDGSSLTPHIQISGDTDNDGVGDVQVFQVTDSSTVELNSLDIVRGKGIGTGAGGGGVTNYGNLTIKNSTISGNSYAGGIGGGGVYNKGELTIIDSTITGNLAEDGGGIFNEYDHTLTITGSTFSNNAAESGSALRGEGGGIANIGTLSVNDSEFLDNHAFAGGGAIVNSINGISAVISSSFTNNSSFGNGSGGAIGNYEGNITIESCVFTENTDYGGESNGAAVYNEDQMSITSSTFTGNYSSRDGGGIANLGTLTVAATTISDNSAETLGGGIVNSGNLTITNANISGNSTMTGGGGVLNENNGVLTITNSTVTNNSSGAGGGIFNFSLTGTVDISNSTISGNTVSGVGGGVSNWGTMTAINNTLIGNSATREGGGILNIGSLTLKNSTFSGNSSLTSGGGIYNNGTLNYTNTIIANSASGGDCYNNTLDTIVGIINTDVHNLVENNAASPNQCGTPFYSSDPKLGPLTDNGGSTPTMALLDGSPAINAGDNVTCASTDQRGIIRPQGARCDIGAFEFGAPPAAVLTAPIGNIEKDYNPNYAWNKVATASHYRLYVTGPKGLVFDQWFEAAKVCDETACAVTPGPTYTLGGGAHAWYVQTYNAVGYGPWSNTDANGVVQPTNFNTTIPSAPGAATLTYPAQGQNLGSDFTPIYTWNKVSAATYYRVYIGGPSGAVYDQWVQASTVCGASTCSINPAVTLGVGSYSWYVQTYGAGGYGPWSNNTQPTTFSTTATSAPGMPTLAYPAQGQNIGAVYTPTYTWNKVGTATWYRVYVGGPSGMVLDQWYQASAVCGASTCSITPTVTLGGGSYSWYAQAWNPAGYGPWSNNTQPTTFTVTVVLPSAATLTYPAQGQNIGANFTPTYTWNKVNDATWYHVYVGGSGGAVHDQWYQASVICGASTCLINPSATLGVGSYSWYIQTYGVAGYGPWSNNAQPTTFTTTATSAPVAPTLTYPTQGQNIGTDYTPAYTWNKVNTATWYRVYIGGPSGMVLDQWYQASAVCGASTCSVTPTNTLGGGTYSWYVQAWNPAGYGPWSNNAQPTTFTTTTPTVPAGAVLTAPTGTIASLTPTFSWNKVSMATWYRLYVKGPYGVVKDQWVQAVNICNTTTCSVSGMTLTSGDHTWWVQTYNSAGYGPWMSSTFKVSP